MFCQNEVELVSNPRQPFKSSEQGRGLFVFCHGIFQSILLGALRYSYKSNPYTGCSCFPPTKFWLLWGLSHKHPGIPSQDLSPALPLEERNPHQRYHSLNCHSVPRTVPTLCLCISLSVYPRSDRWGHWVTKTFSPSLWFTRAGTQCCGSKRPPFPRYQAASTFFFSLLLTTIQLTIPSLSFRN